MEYIRKKVLENKNGDLLIDVPMDADDLSERIMIYSMKIDRPDTTKEEKTKYLGAIKIFKEVLETL